MPRWELAVEAEHSVTLSLDELRGDPSWLLGDPTEDERAPTPEELGEILEALGPERRAVVQHWIESQTPWRETPVTMAHHLTKGRFKLWAYSRLLGRKFRDAVDGRSKRQIWNVPARMGKSVVASQWGPAWALDRDPTTNLILVSYSDALALENAVAVRQILREHARDPDDSSKLLLRSQLMADRQRMDRFVTTLGGGLLAGGILSSLTGFPGDGIVLDDPYKDWPEAHSQARRDLVDHQYRSVIRLRAETEDAWILLVQTRWHEDDQTGRFLMQMEDGTGEAWEHVRIPAIAEEFDPESFDALLRVPDPLGRAPGEVIERERFSLDAVKARALSLGEYLTAAMEQGRPGPEEGGEFKRAWWRIDDSMPEKADAWLSSWDMKLKDKESGDYVVGQVWCRTGVDVWCVDQFRGQWNQATTALAICLAHVRWPSCRRHIVENTGNGPEVMEALRTAMPGYEISDDLASQLGMNAEEREGVQRLRRRGVPGLIPNTPKGSKTVRARAVVSYIEAGNAHLPARASWTPIFIEEHAAFPNGSHDDQVDAMSQAVSKLHRVGRGRTRGYGPEQRNVRAGSVGSPS